MRLPKGASYKLLSTKDASMDKVLEELSSEKFSGYVRLTIEKDESIEDGYLLLKAGEVVGAEYQGGKTLYGSKAYKKIQQASKTLGIIDIYKFTDFQLQISIEENGEALVSLPLIAEVSEKHATSVEEEILRKRGERAALLKKYGLKEPDINFVDSVVQCLSLPNEKEINKKSKELKKEILKVLGERSEIQELDLYIHSNRADNSVGFDIDVYVKPLNKNIEKMLQSIIAEVLQEKITFPYEKGVTISTA